jgi:hypothetical protein
MGERFASNALSFWNKVCGRANYLIRQSYVREASSEWDGKEKKKHVKIIMWDDKYE